MEVLNTLLEKAKETVAIVEAEIARLEAQDKPAEEDNSKAAQDTDEGEKTAETAPEAPAAPADPAAGVQSTADLQ